MRYVAILGIVCLGTLGSVIGCGGETGGETTGSGGGGEASSSSASSSSSGMGGSGGGGMASSSSSSSSGGMMIHGCDQGTADDLTANANTKVAVGANGFTYSPACIRIKKGATVTFEGTFASHPTVGGLAGPPPAPDSASPIKQTNSGTSVTFTFDTAGSYPYYCEYHLPSMAGVVYVEP
jgi:plastocyanin